MHGHLQVFMHSSGESNLYRHPSIALEPAIGNAKIEEQRLSYVGKIRNETFSIANMIYSGHFCIVETTFWNQFQFFIEIYHFVAHTLDSVNLFQESMVSIWGDLLKSDRFLSIFIFRQICFH